MRQYTVAGISIGTILGLGSAASPIGDIPSIVFLSMQGVNNPMGCLAWMKQPTEVISAVLHPCYPKTDVLSFSTLSGGLVFIAVGYIIWKGIELFGKIQSS